MGTVNSGKSDDISFLPGVLHRKNPKDFEKGDLHTGIHKKLNGRFLICYGDSVATVLVKDVQFTLREVTTEGTDYVVLKNVSRRGKTSYCT